MRLTMFVWAIASTASRYGRCGQSKLSHNCRSSKREFIERTAVMANKERKKRQSQKKRATPYANPSFHHRHPPSPSITTTIHHHHANIPPPAMQILQINRTRTRNPRYHRCQLLLHLNNLDPETS